MSAAGWEGILDPGERIVWQGRPGGRIVLKPAAVLLALFGVAFGGFALVWMVMAASMGGGAFWAFGLPHFLIGAGIVGWALGWDAFRRRRSFYTLTDRRAFIATNLPIAGRRLKSYPIDEDTVLTLQDGDPGSVFFHEEVRQTRNGVARRPVGFGRIGDARKLYGLMRAIQRGEKELPA